MEIITTMIMYLKQQKKSNRINRTNVCNIQIGSHSLIDVWCVRILRWLSNFHPFEIVNPFKLQLPPLMVIDFGLKNLWHFMLISIDALHYFIHLLVVFGLEMFFFFSFWNGKRPLFIKQLTFQFLMDWFGFQRFQFTF